MAHRQLVHGRNGACIIYGVYLCCCPGALSEPRPAVLEALRNRCGLRASGRSMGDAANRKPGGMHAYKSHLCLRRSTALHGHSEPQCVPDQSTCELKYPRVAFDTLRITLELQRYQQFAFFFAQRRKRGMMVLCGLAVGPLTRARRDCYSVQQTMLPCCWDELLTTIIRSWRSCSS